MTKVIANNYETHYELDDFTDPWKPAETTVIQHGLGRSSCFWCHWVPLLARHYRVIRRDMRGHEQSAGLCCKVYELYRTLKHSSEKNSTNCG